MSGERPETERLPHFTAKYQACGQRRMNTQKTSGVVIGPAGGTKLKTCMLHDDDDD